MFDVFVFIVQLQGDPQRSRIRGPGATPRDTEEGRKETVTGTVPEGSTSQRRKLSQCSEEALLIVLCQH